MTCTLMLLPGMDGTGDLFAPFIAALDSSLTPKVVRYPCGAAVLEFAHANGG